MSVPDRLPETAGVPPAVEQARADLRRLRERLGLAGGGAMVVGLVASAAGFTAGLPLAVVAVGGLASLYYFPTSNRARWARKVLDGWQEARQDRDLDVALQTDDRVASADALLARIREHAGAGAEPAAAAADMHRLLYDALQDLRAIELLRTAGRHTERLEEFERRAESLRAQVEERMDHALTLIADIYEAVLAHDDAALRSVVARAEDEVRRMRAEQEVSALLDEGT